MKSRAFTLIMCTLFCTLPFTGQTQSSHSTTGKNFLTELDVERSISFENDSKPAEVHIHVPKGTMRLELHVVGTISMGKLTVEIIDPSGVKQGNFSVETLEDSDKSERAHGNYKKSLLEPDSGKWTIKIIPTEATGRVSIHSAAKE